jgi:hypothetical protein
MLIQRLFQTVLISGVVALVVPAAAAELPLCGEAKDHADKAENKKNDKKGNETAEDEKKKDDKKKEAKDDSDAPA